MTEERIATFDEWVKRSLDRSVTMIYRGLCDSSFRLISSLDRALESLPAAHRKPRMDAEDWMLRTFRRSAKGMLEPLPDEAHLMIGRHHGLDTLLMDWTRSVGVATFFAYAPMGDQDRAVVAFNPGLMLNKKYLRLYEDAVGLTARLVAQQGLFMKLQDHPTVELAFEAYVGECGRHGESVQASLVKYVLPRGERARALRFLHGFNVGYASLFPDLTGAALMANLLRNDMDFYPPAGSPP